MILIIVIVTTTINTFYTKETEVFNSSLLDLSTNEKCSVYDNNYYVLGTYVMHRVIGYRERERDLHVA